MTEKTKAGSKKKASQVDWKALSTAKGPATRVPKLLQQLRAADPGDREEAYLLLRDALLETNGWSTAAPAVVAELLDGLAEFPEPELALLLAADLVGADHVRAWLAPKAERAEAEASTRTAAVERRAAILEQLTAARAEARASATVLLATLPELTAESVPALVKLARADSDAAVRASALLALGRLGEDDPETKQLLSASVSAEPRIVRGAAGFASIRSDASRTYQASSALLAEFLAADDGAGTRLPWFRGYKRDNWFRGQSFPDAAASGVHALALSRGSAAKEELVKLVLAWGQQGRPGVLTAQAGKLALVLGEFDRLDFDVVALPEALSETQRAVARGLARTTLIPHAFYGLPAAGGARRRWLGLDAPGPLEKHVEAEVKGKPVAGPVWSVWTAFRKRGVTQPVVPPAFEPHWTEIERWQALVGFCSGDYRFTLSLTSEEIERELARVSSQSGLLDEAVERATDLALRTAAAVAEGQRVTVGLAASALVLLPLVRGGRALDPLWDQLVYVGKEPQSREILLALPEARREAVLFAFLETSSGSAEVLGRTLAVADLAPSKRLLNKLAELSEALKSKGSSSAAELQSQLEKLRKV